MPNIKYDLVIFGATSFVGKLIAVYLSEHLSGSNTISWAIAARSEQKLRALQRQLGEEGEKIPIIIANAMNYKDMLRLCQTTNLILSTVGPYAIYGEELVKTCAETGTDYCDITGETHWIKEMLLRYERVAQRTGARIVSFCAFDSIPSDLGVYFLQQESKSKFASFLPNVKMRVASIRGGVSGGTIASALGFIDALKDNPVVRKDSMDPYQLCFERPKRTMGKQRFPVPRYDSEFKSWTTPFIMEATNMRVVLRSNSLSKKSFDDKPFTYNEAMLTGPGFRGLLSAMLIFGGLALIAILLFFRPLRRIMTKLFLPAPGHGPSKETQLKGHFDIRLLGSNDHGERLAVKVTGDRDPGYGSTAKMAAQSALCLIETPKEETPGGFWTPSTSMGDALLSRLRANAGMSFEVID
jgi:short subunit dehydrogenase-like uncharacterized protein